MRAFVAKVFLTALSALAIFSASGAEKVTFEINSPLTVAVGEAFRVEFTLNAEPDKNSFQAPTFEGFDVIAGPTVSTGTSIEYRNGQMSKSYSYAFTYVLLPQAAGNVTEKANSKLAMSAANVEAKGSAQVNVQGASASVKGDATLTLKGGIVQIN